MEAEAREIIAAAVLDQGEDLVNATRRVFADVGGVELEIPAREDQPAMVYFGDF
ncbi:MAG: hypothetical protein ACOYEV_12915 [Candidatus Nanopelagicales bacterium]